MTIAPACCSALALATPITPTTHALTYAAGAATDPVALALAVPTTMAGLGAGGFGGAATCLVCMMILTFCASRLRVVRAYLDERAAERDRQRRESRRRLRLRAATPLRCAQYGEVRALVDEIERDDAAAARRYDVEQLLERFVELAVVHEHHHATLRRVGDARDDEGFAPMARLRPRSAVKSRLVAERRAAAAARCRAELDRIADELDATEELVKLLAIRVGCPTATGDDEVQTRLADLDEVERGTRQIDEYCAGA